MISPYLDIYCKLMDFDPGATEGYLFCCGDAFERNQPESMWTSTVKKVFKTYSPGQDGDASKATSQLIHHLPSQRGEDA